MNLTRVVFRKWKKNDGSWGSDGIIALFPLDHCDLDNEALCNSFEHVGQHGGADYDGVIRQTVPATPEEYADLKREIESPPYNYKLRVCKRAPNGNRDTRAKPINDHWRKVQDENAARLKAERKAHEESYEVKRKRWDEAVASAKTS